MTATARARDDRRTGSRSGLSRGRPRRRHDVAREASLEARSRGRGCAGSPLALGVALVSATNGKTTTTAMAAKILGAEHRLAWNRAGANLLSGIASALVSGRRRDAGSVRGGRGGAARGDPRTRPRVVSLANLFRDQLDRYGELELVAERWREAVACFPPRRPWWSTPTTRSSPISRRGVRRAALRARRSAPRASVPPARGRLEVLRPLRRSVRVRGCIRRAPRRVPLRRVRAREADARRRGARHRARRAAGLALSAGHAAGEHSRRARASRALQRLQRRRSRLALPRARRVARPRSARARRASARRSAGSSGFPSARRRSSIS